MKASVGSTVLLAALLMSSGAFAADAGVQMQAHMQEMDTLMAAIKAEQDPAKLEALMQQHMELMHAGMEMMSRGEGATNGMTMEDRMQGMEHRMEMMQMMMGQMMEHDTEESARPIHQHKR